MPYQSRFRIARLSKSICYLGLAAAAMAGAQQVQQSTYYRNAARSIAQVLTGGTAQLQAQMVSGRRAISVAVADFDRDGYTDLVTGYAVGTGGALTLQRGNSAAVAPTGNDFTAFTHGVIAPAFQSAAQTFALPVRPDFLLAADVNGDGSLDLLVAAKGDTNAYLVTGRGKGNFNAPRAIALTGTLTALSTWRQANGSSLIVTGVCSAGSCSLQLLDADGGMTAAVPLPGAATAMDMARLNGGNLDDIAVAAGGQVLLFNGDSIAKGSPVSETLPVSHALTLAAGTYVYDARGMMQLAVLDAGGTLHVLARAGVDSHQYTTAEIRARKPWGRGGAPAETWVDPSPKPAGMPWADVETLPNVGPGDGTVAVMVRGRLTVGSGADDLAVMSSGKFTRVAHPSVLNGLTRTPAPVVTLDSTSAPVLSAALVRMSPDPRFGVVMANGDAAPVGAGPEVGGITFTVNATGDTNDSLSTTGRCTTNTSITCSLRDAINLSTQSPAGPNTIVVPSGNYIITQKNTFSDNDSNNANYHYDVDSNVSIVGGGASTTLINANSLDKVMSLNSSNNLGAANAYYTYSIGLTGLTLLNGKNTNPGADNSYGGNFDWEGKDGSLTLTNVTSSNGSVTNGDGGGMHADNYYGTTYDTVTITNCTFSNNSAYAFGGGISVDDDVQAVISGTTVSGNTVTDASGNGGGINLRLPVTSSQAQSTIGSSTISGNTNTSYEGGGIHMEYGAAISGTTFTNNTAAQGGGIHFFSQTTSASVVDSTFTGNTGAIFLQSAANPALEAMSISYSRFNGNTAGSADSGHTAVSVGLPGSTASYGGQVTATNNWWGCNPTTSTTSISGTSCDTAGTNTSASTFSGNPYTILNLTLSTTTPTGAASFSATGSTAQNSSGTAYTGTEDNALSGVGATLVITQPDGTATTDNGTLSTTDSITESATPDTNKVDYGAGTASVTVDGFTVTTDFTLQESDLTVVSTHTGNLYASSTGDTYTLSVTNSGNSVTSGTVTVVDTLPTGFTATAMSGTNWNCNVGTLTCTTTNTASGSSTFPPITLTVTATSTPGTYTNSVAVSGGGELDANNDTATDSTLVVGAPTFSEAFSPANIAVSGTSTVTFTLTNPSTNPVILTGLAFSDTLPTNLKVATPNGVSTTCSGGSVTATDGSSSISFSGATLGFTSSCTVTVNVTSSTAGAYPNTTGTINSSDAPTGSTASATLDVFTTPFFSEAFSPNIIATSGTSSVTFTITNPSTSPATLTGLAFSDTLPTHLVVATPLSASTTCGTGTVAATAGGSSISLSGGQAAPGTPCTVTVNVTSATAGNYSNTTSTLTDTQGITGSAASASFEVLSPPTITESFNPTSISPGATSTVIFTLGTPSGNPIGFTGLAFSDTLPTGLVVYTPTTANNNCGGLVTATGGSSSISFSGGTVAAGSTCQVSVFVTSATAGTYINPTSTVTDTQGVSSSTATATLTVGDTIWLLNGNMELERISESGATLNTTSVTGTTSSLGFIAFDNSGRAWVVGNADSQVYVYSTTAGTVASGFSGAGVNTPTGIAIDGLGNAWVANGNSTISEISSAVTAVSPSTGFQSGAGTLSSPTGILIDSAGSIWVTNSGNNTVTKIIGAAAPAVTPTVTGTTNNTLGTEP